VTAAAPAVLPLATVLDVLDVVHTYADGPQRLRALDGVTLAVGDGEMVCVAGPSGSGKSSLCHLAAGLEVADSGRVEVDGSAPATLDWSVVSVLPQQHGLVSGLTVVENVALPARRLGLAREVDVEGLLHSLDVHHLAGRLVSDTSIGEQQRTALARALVLGPRLAVLDEPTGHQDDEHVEAVLATVQAAAASGTAVLVASHDQRVVEATDRVVLLDSGRVVPGPRV
jgi:ABC-type lipoprotein export system ATPase subunit